MTSYAVSIWVVVCHFVWYLKFNILFKNSRLNIHQCQQSMFGTVYDDLRIDSLSFAAVLWRLQSKQMSKKQTLYWKDYSWSAMISLQEVLIIYIRYRFCRVHLKAKSIRSTDHLQLVRLNENKTLFSIARRGRSTCTLFREDIYN